jgi:hypothetical protein
LGAGDLKKKGESRSAVERRPDEPGMRRVLKVPLYGPLSRGADTSASGKGCALPAKESRRQLPAGKRWRKRKDGTFFEKPALKINLVEAHLNRPSLQEKGQ